MVDGLEEESKKSLQMEAELERQLCEFEIEREQYKAEMTDLEAKNCELILEIQRLQDELESLQKQMANSSLISQTQLGEGVRSTIVTMVTTPTIRAVPTISPTVSPPRGVARAVSLKVGPAPATPAKPPGLIPQALGKMCPTTGTKPVAQSFPTNSVSPLCSPPLVTPQTIKKPMKPGSPAPVTSPLVPEDVGTLLQVAANASQFAENALSPSDGEKAITGDLNSQTNSKIYSGIKVSTAVPVHKPAIATAPSAPNAKKLPVGRGAPPPIPPNKPVLPPQALHRKDATSKPPVPPRSDVAPENSADKNLQRVAMPPRYVASPKQTEDAPSSNVSSEKEDTQVGANNESLTPTSSIITSTTTTTTTSNSLASGNLGSEVLVQELADFQQILVSMASSKLSNSLSHPE